MEEGSWRSEHQGRSWDGTDGDRDIEDDLWRSTGGFWDAEADQVTGGAQDKLRTLRLIMGEEQVEIRDTEAEHWRTSREQEY